MDMTPFLTFQHNLDVGLEGLGGIALPLIRALPGTVH